MSQGSEGSSVLFFDPATCDDNLADLRGADGRLPTFDSEPGTPPPALEAEVACGERGTQTSPTQDTAVPHITVAATQVDQVTVADQGTQALRLPPRSVSFTQTATAPRISSWTQVPRTVMKACGTDMPPVLVTSSGCQAGAYFDNEVIPPGAPRPKRAN